MLCTFNKILDLAQGKQANYGFLKFEFVKKISSVAFLILIFSFLLMPGEVSAASNPTSRVSWTADEVGTEAPNNRRLVRTSDGTLHAFISSLGVTNTCGGSSVSGGIIYVVSTDSGGTWTCNSQLNTDSNFQYASAVTDADDNIYVVYSGFDVKYRKFTKGAGATWTIGSEQTIITGAGSLLGLAGVLEREGTTRLWFALQYRASGTAISTRVYYSDGFGAAPAWTLSADLDTPDANGSNTHYPVIVRYGSNIGVIYANYNGSTYDLNWRHRADSDGLTTWSTAETIISTSSSNKHLSATVDNNNYIHLVYGATGTNSSNVTVTYKYYNGTSWSSAVTLSGAANSGGHSPSITTNGTDIWVFWQGRHNTGLGSSTTLGRVVYRKGISPFASGNFEAETVLNSADRAYDKIYTYIGGTYADKTTAGNDVPNNITLGASVGDITYFGHSEKYRAVTGLMVTAGAGGVVVYEYWNGSAWTTLTTFGTRFPNFTNATVGGYEVDFLPPSDWATSVVDGTNAPGSYYYVRARLTTAYTTTPVAENFWAYPQTSAIQVPVKATGGILPIVWGETSPFTTGDAIVQFNSLSINTNPSDPSSLGGHVSGSYTADTTPTLTFTLADPDRSDTVKYQIQIDDTSNFSSPVVDFTSTLAAQGSTSFTVGQAAGSGSYATGSSGQTLSGNSYYWRVKAIDSSSAESSYSTANSAAVAFIVDATAPSVPGTPTTSSSQIDTTPTWTWTASTDGGSGLAATPYTLQWSQISTFASGVSSTTSSLASFTHTTSLSDGTWYFRVKAKDTVENESAYSLSGSITIDATTPVSIDLDSPGDNSYTNSERPTFKWKTTSDATSGLSKYVLEIDNPSIGGSQPSGDFTIDSIPTSRTTDYETNKYTIHYENFNDSDNTNNYISVYTKSHSDWRTSENDGKIREGKMNWKVKAVDNAGNETSSSRTLFVDRTSPSVVIGQINDVFFSSSSFLTTDRNPTIFGKITDTLSGADNNGQTKQDENGPKIASGLKEVNIKLEKKEGLIYKLVTLYKINMDKAYYTCDPDKIVDNSKHKCDKYLPFEYTPKENLELGIYKITLSGKDKADNTSTNVSLVLNISTFGQIKTPEEKQAFEDLTKELKTEEKQKMQEKLEITKSIKPNIFEKAAGKTTDFISLIFVRIGDGIGFVFGRIGFGAAFTGSLIGNGYNAFANNATGSTKNVIANLAFAAGEKSNDISHGLGTAIIKIGYLFVPEPTRIFNVKVTKSTPTSMNITWDTNHPASGKINYGLTADYGQDVQTDKRTTKHEFVITGLAPETTYHYEVMSQNRNYVYDASHTFTTPAK